MSPETTPTAATQHAALSPGPWAPRLAIALLAGLAVAAYANSLSGVFVFDDLPAIVDNPSLHRLSAAWSPPAGHGVTVEGRPLLNLSLALNYAVGGASPRGYHVVNLGIHLLAGLTLFGVLRRILALPAISASVRRDALLIATAAAAIWLVHPLQTESVTYVVQRAESLCGLAYLLVLYAFLRHATAAEDSPQRLKWALVAAAATVAGLATKEVMITVPVVVLALDRLLVTPRGRTVWAEHHGFYVALGLGWLPVAAWMLTHASRGDTAGLTSAVSVGDYLRTQIHAVALYLRLAVWPSPLVFDYGRMLVGRWSEVVVPGICLSLLALATALGWWLRKPVALLGVCFFCILAPSSSIVPIATQTIAEHRMYLPLAPVVLGVLLAFHACCGRRGLLLALPAVAAALIVTIDRNQVYQNAEAVWADTLAKRPENPRAHVNLGVLQFAAGRRGEAAAHFTEAVRLAPSDSDAQTNLSQALRALGRHDEALDHAALAVRLDPRSAPALVNYATMLLARHRFADAVDHFAVAATIEKSTSTRIGWAAALEGAGRISEAEAALRQACVEEVATSAACAALGDFLVRQGRPAEAVEALALAVSRDPDSADGCNRLGFALLLAGRPGDAVTPLARAVARAPEAPAFRANYGVALARSGDTAAARAELSRALALDPENPLAKAMLLELGK